MFYHIIKLVLEHIVDNKFRSVIKEQNGEIQC